MSSGVGPLFASTALGGSGGLKTVRGGEFCSLAGSKDITSAGTILTCRPASDGRLRFQR